MLGINMEDVITVLNSVTTQLVIIGVALVAAILVTFFTGKKRIAKKGTRRLVHSITWLVALAAIVVAVYQMMFGPLQTLLNNASGSGQLSQESITQANDLAAKIEEEGIVLLENDDATLPLQNTKVNVFGWASTNPIYGGTGSGSMNANYETTSLLQGLTDAGIEYNTELSEFYTSYRTTRPVIGMVNQEWTLPEPPAATYTDKLIANAKDYSDTAVVVIARSGGEGADLPHKMSTVPFKGPQTADEIAADLENSGFMGSPETVYHNNSTDYEDFTGDQGYLELSRTERDMLDLVCANFDKVIVVYNGANDLNMSFVDEHPQIKGVLWAPPAGQTGFSALGAILTGKVNPSGKTTDTFVRDFTQAPWYNNIGNFKYDNTDEFNAPPSLNDGVVSFVDYVEGIYVGYRYYETADAEGAIDYDKIVQYPFGHGLSYTTFEQKMGDVTYADDGSISFEVTVTNTGSVAGKDVVEVFYNPPYTDGGIEKASANLVEFEKTDLLDPGASQTISITFDDDDMASYDYLNAKAYVLEKGDYIVSINRDAHTIIDKKTVKVPETITYNTDDTTHSGDKVAATNIFDDAAGDVTYLSRAGHFANYDEATAAPENFTMPDEVKASFYNNTNYELESTGEEEMPTTGAKNGVALYELYGKDYDDPTWDTLLDELTYDEMTNLVGMAGYGNAAVASINKPLQADVDGPAALNNNFTGVGSIGFPASTAVANTFNKQLAYEYGKMIGQMAHEMNVTGWYAPAENIHRSAYAGRNFEYFSEDPLLSGVMAGQQIAGAKELGVYGFVKHYALNDQETNRNSMLCTWTNEQALREIYTKGFEITVKEGGATAVMSAFNYIGNRYAGAHPALLQTLLRDEWGFRGFVLTDYFGGYGYQLADMEIRNGGDAMLATTDTGFNLITDKSASTVSALREASHNILYTAVNSYVYENGQPQTPTPAWVYAFYGVSGVLCVLALLRVIRAFMKRNDA